MSPWNRAAGRRRLAGVLLAGCTATTLLAGCGSEDASDLTAAASSAAASSSSAAASSSGQQPGDPDLASGLLPAGAFGPDATVVAVSPEQLRQGAGLAVAGADVQITPESCRAAVDGTQPDLDDVEDIAALSAITGAATTVEMLVRGGPTEDSVDQLAAAAERCPQAQLSSPEIGQANVTFENLPVEDLGDGAALVHYTTSITGPDGVQVSVPTLIGAVEDGDRLLLLLNIDAGQEAAATTDPAAFADLLAQAYQVQADALG